MESFKLSGLSLVDSMTALSTVPVARKPQETQVVFLDAPKQDEGIDSRDLLIKSIIYELGNTSEKVDRLAFEVDPNLHTYNSIYISKHGLIPDAVIKKIVIQDDLVAAIVHARETQMGSFGRPRYERHETGFVVEPMAGVIDKLDTEKKAAFNERIRKAIKKLSTCGSEEGVLDKDKMSFSQYMQMSARNAVSLGRIATEIIHEGEAKDQFHSFRPVDVGTIFHAAKEKTAIDKLREDAHRALEQIKKTKLDPARFAKGDYAWIQVIEGQPRQAFTDKELYVCNFYPVVDIEMLGYPVTPIDTIFTAISTHLNINTHNRLYFQTGRASRGMLIFKSDDVTPQTLERVKQNFNASINGVERSWRMPVFSCPTDGDIVYTSIDSSAQRDAEYIYLLDQNARTILSAFQMSPDELPGWSYLSKGTNSQALSEGNQEFRIEAGRDQGIRPLLHRFEDFINTHLFPLIDSELAACCRVRLVGLDADTPEKETVRLIQDAPVFETYDGILERVEKKLVGREMGGAYPLNPQFQAILDKFYTVGEQKAFFTGDESARNDPDLQYIPNQFWFNWQQMQQAASQTQPSPSGEGGPPQGGGGPPGGGGEEQVNPEGKAPNANQASDTEPSSAPQAESGEDLTRSIDQALFTLSKSEKDMPQSKRKLLAQQKMMIAKFRKEMEGDLEQALGEVLDIANKSL